MKENIFTSTKNWKYTNNDQKAQQKFTQIQRETRNTLADNFYQRPLVHYQHIKSTHLYGLMKTIPKGVLHHIHYFCNDDQQFYREHVLNDSRIYLSKDMTQIFIGTVQQAGQNGWISMNQGKQKFGEKQWLRKIVNLTCFTCQQLQQMDYKSKQTWQIFQKKIMSPLSVLLAKDIFQKYSRHMLIKYIKNGYDRIQIRCILQTLNEYDSTGKFIKQHTITTYMNSLEAIIEELMKQYPNFSCGIILVGFKCFTDLQNQSSFREVCQLNWNKLVGFDFVQEQDRFDSLQRFDRIVDKVLQDYPHLNHLKKIYHAGETANHLTDNIDIAVKAGTVRIGHGINILQRIQFLPHCKHICFQKNPISNLLLGYKSDLRESSAPILLGLGYPVSISADDPGKFGYEDTTPDYFACAVSYNWTLRHFKLIAYHSINHAVCQEKVKHRLIASFQKSWNEWIGNFLEDEHIKESTNEYKYQDIFNFARNWSFSKMQEAKDKLYINFIDEVIASVPADIYQNNFISYKKQIKQSPLYGMLKKMPKGTLQSCHFMTNHDLEFITSCVIPYHHIYLNEYSKELVICTPTENQLHHWTSLQKQKLIYQTQQDLAQYIYSLTAFNSQQAGLAIGHQGEFWRIYRKKYNNLLNLLESQDIFRKYTQYVLKKFATLNYQRVQFRIEPINLAKYAENGEKVKDHDYSQMMQIIDEELAIIKNQNTYFTAGFIILGNKKLTKQQNYRIFDYFAASKWSKLIAFDFQQTVQDDFAPLAHYNETIDQIIMKYQELPISKLYQAGNSSNHSNTNIEDAINSGTLRISNGLNILQQVQVLPRCKNTCFEINPILNLCQGASKRMDFRLSVAPILLGLGFPVTISSDLCGIIGFQDTIYDLYLSAISFNWTLKHIKLIILHSINYSCITQGTLKIMLTKFQESWQQWINLIN